MVKNAFNANNLDSIWTVWPLLCSEVLQVVLCIDYKEIKGVTIYSFFEMPAYVTRSDFTEAAFHEVQDKGREPNIPAWITG